MEREELDFPFDKVEVTAWILEFGVHLDDAALEAELRSREIEIVLEVWQGLVLEPSGRQADCL